MQLRDKFEQLEDFDEDKMVEIAENFAIGFVEWVDKNYYQNHNETNRFTECEEDIHNGISFTIKQLLEIYKKTL